MKIFFDESGQTGARLFDVDQPYFGLGSTNIEEEEASEILNSCFPVRQGKELKSRNLLRRPNGRRSFLKFSREVGKFPKRFCAAKIGKRFTVISKMVDFLVEPLLHAQGYDFYADNYAVRFANSANFVFDKLLERSIADNLMRLYNKFAQNPTKEGIMQLQAALEVAAQKAPYGSETTLNLMSEGARHFEEFHSISLFNDTNDIHVTAVISCMGHWQEQTSDSFEVIHDESLHFFTRSERWKSLTDPNIEPQVIVLGPKKLSLPIPVVSTTSAHSHECSSLQLCDLVAGFVTQASAPIISNDERAFFRTVIDAGIGEILIFPVDAGSDFAKGPPLRASGPDIIDKIASATKSPFQG